jgi:hypothetical protein
MSCPPSHQKQVEKLCKTKATIVEEKERFVSESTGKALWGEMFGVRV